MKHTTFRGFTIIEMTIYIALMSMLILVISRIFISSLDVQLESEAVSSVDQDGRYLLSRFMYDISQADEVLLPENLGDSTDSLILRTNGTNYLYELAGDLLQITDDLDTQQLNSIGTRVSNLSFTKLGNPDGNDTVRIQFRLESTVEEVGGPEIKDFQTTIGLR